MEVNHRGSRLEVEQVRGNRGDGVVLPNEVLVPPILVGLWVQFIETCERDGDLVVAPIKQINLSPGAEQRTVR